MAQAEYNMVPREFFSGSDAYIFFNNMMIDQLIAIQFSLSENIIPIYGYASYTYDAVARGSRIVTGSFRINFIENMYLYSVMNEIAYQSKENYYSPAAIQTIIDRELNSEDIAQAVKYGNMDKIRSLIEKNEDRVWGKQGTNPIDKYRKPFFAANLDESTKRNGFDIVIAYGDPQFNAGEVIEELPSTVKVINGVHLTGVTQIVQPTGEAIFEEYTFIARDLDNTINTTKTLSGHNIERPKEAAKEASEPLITNSKPPVSTGFGGGGGGHTSRY